MDLLGDLANHYGTDKGPGLHGYTTLYQRLFAHRREQVERVLEIGIFQGASIRMWRDYFPNATIYGLDIYPQRVATVAGLERVVALQANGSRPETWSGSLLPGDFDLIVDDGSHIPHEQVDAIRHGFWHLRPGGFWFVEDIHSSFLPYYCPGGAGIVSFLLDRVMEQQAFGYGLGDFYAARREHGKCLSPLGRAIIGIQVYKSLLILERAAGDGG